MSKFKRTSCILLVGILALFTMPVSALAANVKDTELPTKFIGYTISQGVDTSMRSKTNTTPNYIHNQSGFDLWVRTLVPGNVNVTKNGHAIVPSAKRVIHGYTYER